ncbi:MAG: flagellar biosynthesis protein FlhB [Thermoleophilaceae bacterium]
MGAGDKTEKATPKRLDEARKKGQVAKSQDLNSAVVLLASFAMLAGYAPHFVDQLKSSMSRSLALIAHPQIVTSKGLGGVLTSTFMGAAKTVAPIALTCLVAGVLTNVFQVRWRPSIQAIKPSFSKVNPGKGIKQLLSVRSVFEAGKSIAKLIVVLGVAALSLIPKLPEIGSMVGTPPDQLLGTGSHMVLGIVWRVGGAYLLIALVDYVWQKWRFTKDMMMTKEEVKEEAKGQAPPSEIRGAMRRRQMAAARARMMSDVPEADVVVTNPTHFSVALKYDGAKVAPEVVAKGKDLIAMQIRRIAEEHGVPVVPDPPLARSLHASVEIGQMIPEDFFQAVAQLLAFVYRVAGRKAATV